MNPLKVVSSLALLRSGWLEAEAHAEHARLERRAALAASSVDGCAIFTPGDYRITSQFGPRVHPVTGEASVHKGVDVAVLGPIFAPTRGALDYSESEAGGVAVGVTLDEGWAKGYRVVVRHMGFPHFVWPSKRVLFDTVASANGESVAAGVVIAVTLTEFASLAVVGALKGVGDGDVRLDAKFGQYRCVARASGDTVEKGALIGWVGNSGRVSPAPSVRDPLAGRHAHVEVHDPDGAHVDPTPFIEGLR